MVLWHPLISSPGPVSTMAREKRQIPAGSPPRAQSISALALPPAAHPWKAAPPRPCSPVRIPLMVLKRAPALPGCKRRPLGVLICEMGITVPPLRAETIQRLHGKAYGTELTRVDEQQMLATPPPELAGQGRISQERHMEVREQSVLHQADFLGEVPQ